MTSEHLFQHQPASSSFGRVTKFTVGGYNNCQWGNEPSANGARAHRFSEIIRLPNLVTDQVSKTFSFLVFLQVPLRNEYKKQVQPGLSL